VERLTVVAGPDAWTNYITTNIYASYFSQWAKCDAAKRILSAAVVGGYYVFPTTNFVPDNAVYVGKSNLLARMGAPTNWWDVTPRFNLAMETNGWRLMPAAMSNVVWIQDGWPSGVPLVFNETNAVLYQGAGTNWGTSGGSPDYFNYAQATTASNFTRKSSYFYWSSASSFQGLYLDSIEFCGVTLARVTGLDDFDSQGDSVSTNFYKVLDWTNSVGGESPSFMMHADRTNRPPNWSGSVNLGWIFDGQDQIYSSALYKYNGTTNGFKWFP
jgi:hypothetical protein